MIIATYVAKPALEALRYGDVTCHRLRPGRPVEYAGPFYRPCRVAKFIPGKFAIAPNYVGLGLAVFHVMAVGREGTRIVVHLA